MLKHCIAPAVAGLLMLSPAVVAAQAPTGQPQQPPQQQEPRDEQPRAEQPRAEQPRAEQPRAEHRDAERRDAAMVIRADRLIGQAVRDQADERLGRIDDLALNLEDKRIAYAVVARGGLFGIGAEQVAVSWDQLRPDQAERVVRIDAPTLQQARQIDTRTAWPTDVGRAGDTPAEQPVGTAGRAPQTQVLSVSRIIGMDVRNQQGDNLGQIDDIALERDGSIAYAVIAHGGFLGMGHDYVAVPWDRLNLDSQREQVMLNVTQQQLESAREFEHGERWPGRVDWPFGN